MRYVVPFAYTVIFSLFGVYVLITKDGKPIPETSATLKETANHTKFINKPVDNSPSSLLLSKLYKKQDAEQLRSVKRLNNSDVFVSLNSEELPNVSAFGTNFSDPFWAQKLCRGTDIENCSAKFKQMETRLRYSSKYNMSACIVQKNMSTMLQAIMCYLFDEDKFIASGRSVGRESHHGKFCNRKNEVDSSDNSTKAVIKMRSLMKNWNLFAIVREPVDRFLSGFVDKCVRQPYNPKNGYCNGCASNMTCFIQSEYKRIITNSKKAIPSRNFEDRHFFPQSWRCNFETEFDRYKFIQYSSNPTFEDQFLSKLFKIFQKQGVPKQRIAYINDQLSGGRTVHSTVESEARKFFEERLLSSPFLLEYVFRMFYWDFQLFQFKLPSYGSDIPKDYF
uniref:Carbohydrate sulfotransferase n=1 Tax=Panagrellus redivivus TaxID=6233 RepID=A0A7E4UZU5_PANRE